MESKSPLHPSSKNVTDFCVQLGFEEVIIRVRLAEWMLREEGFSSRAVESITSHVSISIHCSYGLSLLDDTYIVKQSYIKAKAAGLMFTATSSGIGGA